ncbi:phage late control D family protein [Arthrobacter antioxidans]|uniref:phage late control D family protein n=1 Tax=Arthrobacter antioxidans TaxID=2895818 RepID=UPI001FFE4352|nr:contractile injection system protein, VgrG/Pvc8 family [Arthrobacter antioxidans]
MSTRTGYSLTVDGSPLPAVVLGQLERVECEEHLRLADVLRLHFSAAQKAGARGWEIIDDGLFGRLARIRLDVTVGSGSQPLFEGYVVEAIAGFSSDPDKTTYTVVAFDTSVLLHLQARTRAWPDMSDGDVADAVFADYGLASIVESTQPTRADTDQTLLQSETDMQLLRRLARRNGYECYVDLNQSGVPTGHFHPAELDAEPQGIISVGLGAQSNTEKLSVSHDMLRPVSAAAHNVDHGSLEVQEASAIAVAAPLLGGESVLTTNRPRTHLVRGTALAAVPELQSYAQAVTDRSALAIRAEGEVRSATYGGVIRARKPLLVRGAGGSLSGTFLVERVFHAFAGTDYTQSFTLVRNATGLAGEDFTGMAGG